MVYDLEHYLVATMLLQLKHFYVTTMVYDLEHYLVIVIVVFFFCVVQMSGVLFTALLKNWICEKNEEKSRGEKKKTGFLFLLKKSASQNYYVHSLQIITKGNLININQIY